MFLQWRSPVKRFIKDFTWVFWYYEKFHLKIDFVKTQRFFIYWRLSVLQSNFNKIVSNKKCFTQLRWFVNLGSFRGRRSKKKLKFYLICTIFAEPMRPVFLSKYKARYQVNIHCDISSALRCNFKGECWWTLFFWKYNLK